MVIVHGVMGLAQGAKCSDAAGVVAHVLEAERQLGALRLTLQTQAARRRSGVAPAPARLARAG